MKARNLNLSCPGILLFIVVTIGSMSSRSQSKNDVSFVIRIYTDMCRSSMCTTCNLVIDYTLSSMHVGCQESLKMIECLSMEEVLYYHSLLVVHYVKLLFHGGVPTYQCHSGLHPV